MINFKSCARHEFRVKVMRTFLLMLFMLVSLCGQAQHLKFMGIPLDGNIEKFDSLIQEKGFVRKQNYHTAEVSKTSYYYKGAFMEDSVEASIAFTPKNHLVYSARIAVYFDDARFLQQTFLRYQKAIEAFAQVEDVDVDLVKDMIFYDCGAGNIVLGSFEGKNYRFVSIDFFDKKNSPR